MGSSMHLWTEEALGRISSMVGFPISTRIDEPASEEISPLRVFTAIPYDLPFPQCVKVQEEGNERYLPHDIILNVTPIPSKPMIFSSLTSSMSSKLT